MKCTSVGIVVTSGPKTHACGVLKFADITSRTMTANTDVFLKVIGTIVPRMATGDFSFEYKSYNAHRMR